MDRSRLVRSLCVASVVALETGGGAALARDDETARPPVARQIETRLALHDDPRVDHYFWMRDRSDPAVRDYLDAENAYTDRVMQPTHALQEKLYQEMLGRIQQADLSVPHRDRGYYYYTRTEESKQYPIFCRRKGDLSAPEQVTLDPNEIGRGHKFFSVGRHEVSDDGKWLAYTVDVTGFRQYTLHIKNLETGALLADRAERVGSVAWAADHETVFYTVEDDAKRQYRLFRHRLGATGDELIFEEQDERFDVSVSRTRSRRYLLLKSESQTTSEVRFLPADEPAAPWRLIAARVNEREYDVDHHGDWFYLRVNDTGRNFRIARTPVADPEHGPWHEFVAHRPEVMLEGMSLFADHCVIRERESGLQRLHVTDLRSGASRRVEFPEPAYALFPAANPEFHTTTFRYNYQSFVTPMSVFDYDMHDHSATLLKQTPVLGGYDPTQYECRRESATAGDGTRIPISIVAHKKTPRDGSAPLLLHGYGSYGASYPITFSSNRVSLLDRGVIVAVAHVRGGGENGKTWHDGGRMLQKKNTFSDFIAAAEFLVREKYTAPDRLVAEGGSAGGLLVGAVANARPDLFKAVVSKMPFVDVINTMADPSLPLTVTEYEEWGNPSIRSEYDYIKSYCPYSNIAHQPYPAMLVRTSFNDSQVMYWEPAKYVAKLRVYKTDSNPLLLKTNMAGGHSGSSGRYDRLREEAFDYAFILQQIRGRNDE